MALAPPAAGAEHDCIALSTASFDRLRKLIHIDEVRAEEIIDRREQRRFVSVEEITVIRGIAQGRLSDILDQGAACIDGDRSQGERQ